MRKARPAREQSEKKGGLSFCLQRQDLSQIWLRFLRRVFLRTLYQTPAPWVLPGPESHGSFLRRLRPTLAAGRSHCTSKWKPIDESNTPSSIAAPVLFFTTDRSQRLLLRPTNLLTLNPQQPYNHVDRHWWRCLPLPC